MVSVRTAVRQGFTLARQARSAVWVLFAANMGLAIVAGLPIYHGMLRVTSHSLMSQKLATGFSVNWLTDFAFNNPGSLAHYAQFIAALGLVALPLNAFLAGGVLTRFHDPQSPFRLGAFFRDCGRYAWRMLFLMAIALAGYWAVFHFVQAGLANRVDRTTYYWMDDRTVFLLKLGVGLLLLLALALVNLVIDYTRVRMVFNEGSGVLESFLAALGFSIRHLPSAVAVYALPSLGGLALLGVYRLLVPWHLLNAALAGNSTASSEAALALALLFIGQQLVIFGRYWFRVATWAGEWSLYAGTRPPAKPAEVSGDRAAA